MVRMSKGRGVTGAQDIARAEAEAQVRNSIASLSRSKQPTSFLSLPREIRDYIYELHLPTAYEQSRPLDPGYQLKGTAEDNFLSVREDWRNKHNLDLISKNLYQPVYYEYNMGNTRFAAVWVNCNRRPERQAREHSVPSLMLLNHPIQIAREAGEMYIGQKLYVNVDSINWFQTWCLDLPEQDRISIRRLHIGARARIFSFHHNRKMDMHEHSGHNFTIRLSGDNTILTIYSRLKLTTTDLNMLESNLLVLLRPKLQAQGSKFDGRDILEALFAFHYKRSSRKRADMVVGFFFKKLFSWDFECEEEDLRQFEQLKRKAEVKSWIEGIQVDRHILLRFTAGEGEVKT